MALNFISLESTPTYIATSDDVVDSKIAGANLIGKTVYITDIKSWYVIGKDLNLLEYTLPVNLTGDITVGTVDQGSPGVNAWFVAGAGVAGTPDTHVLSVQGIAGGEPLEVSTGGLTNAELRSTPVPIIGSVNAIQTSTNDSTLVVGATLSAWSGLSVSYTVVNTGDDTISYIVYGGNASDLSDKVIIQASTDILSGATSSYSAFVAPFSYYAVFIESKVDDTPGEATVRGVVKS